MGMWLCFTGMSIENDDERFQKLYSSLTVCTALKKLNITDQKVLEEFNELRDARKYTLAYGVGYTLY